MMNITEQEARFIKKYRELPIEGQVGIQAVIKAYQPYIKPKLISREGNVLKVGFHHRKGGAT